MSEVIQVFKGTDKFAVHAQSLADLPEVKEFYAFAESALREQEERENPKPLSAFLAPMDSYTGLKRKFLVFKSDTGEMIENCFVLRPDKDQAAVAALRAYAGATDNKTLANDIIDWVGEDRNEPLTLDELMTMDGEPVWLKIAGGVWGLVDMNVSVVWLNRGGDIDLAKIAGLAYRSKPK